MSNQFYDYLSNKLLDYFEENKILNGERFFISLDEDEQVLSFYNLGKSHLSKILGISRPSLYAWIDGSSEPAPQNFAKVEQLYSIICELRDTDDKSIHHGFIDNALPGQNKSLYQLFVENNNLKTQEIKNLIQDALTKSIHRMININKRRDSEYEIAHSDAEKELTFEENV